MKTIHQIKDEVVQDYGWASWEEIYDADGVTNHIIEVIAERTAREALKNAAENVEIDWGWDRILECEDSKINMQSILSDKNIPEL